MDVALGFELDQAAWPSSEMPRRIAVSRSGYVLPLPVVNGTTTQVNHEVHPSRSRYAVRTMGRWKLTYQPRKRPSRRPAERDARAVLVVHEVEQALIADDTEVYNHWHVSRVMKLSSVARKVLADQVMAAADRYTPTVPAGDQSTMGRPLVEDYDPWEG